MALEQLGPSEIATFFTLARYPALLFFVGHTRAWHCRIPRAATVHISPLGRQRPSAPSTQCTAGIHLTFWFLQPSDSVVCSSRTAWGESPSRAATIPQASETCPTTQSQGAPSASSRVPLCRRLVVSQIRLGVPGPSLHFSLWLSEASSIGAPASFCAGG